MPDLYFCTTCNKYTLHTTCNTCHTPTILKKPPRFSIQDHYGKYRRNLRKSLHHNE